jgi:hypothetical protein
MHGLITGNESRQQLYTMCTRGRRSNHIYLQLVGDGDPHTLIRPDTIRPSTATELLEQILARDEPQDRPAPCQRDQHDPAVQLGDTVERYLDALQMAAENVVGARAAQALEASSNQLMPGLSDEPAWPTLRAHLLLIAMNGADPHERLRAACDAKELISADDRAAVLDWRLDDTSIRGRGGPLPWLPGIPDRIDVHPEWGPYLAARSRLVAQLAGQVRLSAAADAPVWTGQPHALPAELMADVQVWCAANQIDPGDLRPTGPTRLGRAAQIWQQQLDKRLAAAEIETDRQWRQLLAREIPSATTDPFLPQLTERLSFLTRAGLTPPCSCGRRPQQDPYPIPPRGSPVVAHPRSATTNAEPATRNP